jgi:hypothetical protein
MPVRLARRLRWSSFGDAVDCTAHSRNLATIKENLTAHDFSGETYSVCGCVGVEAATVCPRSNTRLILMIVLYTTLLRTASKTKWCKL